MTIACNSFRKVVEELPHVPELKITLILADMVERHYLRGMVTIAGKYGCEMCKACAETRGGISWTFPHCMGAGLRTPEESEHFAR